MTEISTCTKIYVCKEILKNLLYEHIKARNQVCLPCNQSYVYFYLFIFFHCSKYYYLVFPLGFFFIASLYINISGSPVSEGRCCTKSDVCIYKTHQTPSMTPGTA